MRRSSHLALLLACACPEDKTEPDIPWSILRCVRRRAAPWEWRSQNSFLENEFVLVHFRYSKSANCSATKSNALMLLLRLRVSHSVAILDLDSCTKEASIRFFPNP